MKSLPDAGSPNRPGFPKKRSPKPLPEEIRQIAHQLLNHLSVVNLCSFNLKSKLAGTTAAALSRDTELLERSVEEATACAKRLSQVAAESASRAPTKKSVPLKPAEQIDNSVPLLAPTR